MSVVKARRQLNLFSLQAVCSLSELIEVFGIHVLQMIERIEVPVQYIEADLFLALIVFELQPCPPKLVLKLKILIYLPLQFIGQPLRLLGQE